MNVTQRGLCCVHVGKTMSFVDKNIVLIVLELVEFLRDILTLMILKTQLM